MSDMHCARVTLAETISAFARSWGDTRKANARLIVAALKAYPALGDKIPDEVRLAAQKEAT